MWGGMPVGLGSGMRPTTRGLSGPGCWGRMRWLITKCTGIGRRHRVFWSRWEEASIRLDLGASARFLVAMLLFRRRDVLRRHGALRKPFGFGSFWLAAWKVGIKKKELTQRALR